MNTLIKQYGLWLIGFGLLGLLSCNRQKKECEGKTRLTFEFDIPYTITPMQDTFSVGDTIWMEFDFSNQMYNKNNGKTYTVNDFEFKMYGFTVDLLDTLTVKPMQFTMLDKDGNIDEDRDRNGYYYHINTKMTDNKYTWRAGFVLEEKGLFAFIQNSEIRNDGPLADQSPPQHITECPNEGVALDFHISNGNGNAYMLDNAAGIGPREIWKKDLFEQSGFAFYVKE